MEDVEELDYDESKHDCLLSAVSKLDKTQHIKQPSRNEPTNLSSEFNLIKSSNKFDINNVVKVLENTAHSVNISKKLKKSHDVSKVLRKPLEKPQRERIKRSTGYEETKTRVGRWDPVVARARTVDYVSFPLKHISHKMQPTTEFLSKLTLKSPLEMELDEVDPQPHEEKKDEEDEKVYPMSYEEMIEHRQHTAKLRAQQSFVAAKAKRQGKIKSKKYHRILKKERLKQQIKEFEELQKTDPEEALKKLEELEKARALERHTLRHKNTGKWAKNLLVRAKYDKEVRQQLAEQLAVSRNLTTKAQNESSDDEVEESENIPDFTLSQDPSNPWMLQSSQKSNVDAEFDFGYKKYIKGKMFKRKAASDSDSEAELDAPTEFGEIKEKLTTLLNKSGSEKPSNKKIKNIDDNQKQAKNQAKSKLQKETRKPKITSTSAWKVDPLDNSSDQQTKPSFDIIEDFDTLETNLKDKVKKKLSNLRQDLKKMERRSTTNKRKSKIDLEVDSLEYLKMKNKKMKPIIDEELNETSIRDLDSANDKVDKISKAEELMNKHLPATKIDSAIGSANIDPTRFIQAKPKYLNTALPGGSELDNLDDEEQVVPRVNIEEVFEEDDVVASFRQEKEDEANKDQPTDIDLSLPGWGSWGGKGVKAPKKRRNRFILKAPPKMPRRDENKGDIIIKEYKDPKLASHKVSEVPYPFTSVKDYEASIRAPLGNTFIPEKAHKKLIRPNVITKAGIIIDPMDEEELLLPKNRSFSKENVIKFSGNL